MLTITLYTKRRENCNCNGTENDELTKLHNRINELEHYVKNDIHKLIYEGQTDCKKDIYNIQQDLIANQKQFGEYSWCNTNTLNKYRKSIV